MKPFFTVFSRSYVFFSPRRKILYAGTLFIVFLFMMLSSKIQVSENIASLLPDDRSEATRLFSLLEHMPFSRKVAITLSAGPGTETERLLDAGRELSRSLGPPYFTRVVSGPGGLADGAFFAWVLESLPNLITESDLRRIDAALTPSSIRLLLEALFQRLLFPTGIAEKALLREDPLNLAAFGLEKIQSMNPFPGTRIVRNQFLSADGQSTLILADTPVEATDYQEGKRLCHYLEERIARHVPPDIRARYISAHRYTVANADVIQKDVWRVIGLSTACLLVIFLIFLRHWRAGFVFLVPVSSLGAAACAVYLVFPEVSAVTIGFGAVLLGISVDFAIHIYFALSSGNQNPGAVLDEIARPLLFSALTTLSAFAVLLFSILPGQRQTAVFSMAGLVWAVAVSLWVLPHLLSSSGQQSKASPWRYASHRAKGRWRIFLWAAVMVLGAFAIRNLKFDGDLGALNRVPDSVLTAEEKTQKTWGDFRRTAMILCRAPTLETALAQNYRLFSLLETETGSQDPVSIAPVFPPVKRQEMHRKAWEAYWLHGRGARHLATLNREAARIGFSPGAFQPFLDRLRRKASPITLETFSKNGLASMLEPFLSRIGTGFSVATLVPDTPAAVTAFNNLKDALPGVLFISQSRFRETVSDAVTFDFMNFLIRAAGVCLFLTALLFRRITLLVPAVIPAVSGVVVMLGGMAVLGLPFNLSNIAASILVIGLSIDYGIFMVCRLAGGYRHQTQQAVFVSGLTTLSGFAALAAAHHPALSSIGITVILGIGAALPAALWVVPSFYRMGIRRTDHASA
ncbi:MAG: MMPL family transporter [Deltaproteobacteria bacterium]|nr:MMPL family transporter [Deltaproteobacteria bacterium]